MWTEDKIKDLGFKLINNNKLWYHFRGHGFDVMVNLNLKECEGNLFNFKSLKSNFKGNFKARLKNEEEFKNLLKYIV